MAVAGHSFFRSKMAILSDTGESYTEHSAETGEGLESEATSELSKADFRLEPPPKWENTIYSNQEVFDPTRGHPIYCLLHLGEILFIAFSLVLVVFKCKLA